MCSGCGFGQPAGIWTQLHMLREVKDGTKARPFDLEKDLAGLPPLIEGIKDLRLIAIDAVPVPAGRGAAAARKAEALFEQLAALARRHKVAVLAIARQAGGDYLSRKPISFGTLPLTAATTAFLVEIDPNDEGRRLLLQVKNELSGDPGTLAFEIVRRENAAAITFAPAKPAGTPREFTARNAPGFNSAKAEAIAFLRGLFGKATHLKVTDIEAEARAVGLLGANQPLSQCRPLRDARAALDLTVIRAGFGPGGSWVWAKPDAAETDQAEHAAAGHSAGAALGTNAAGDKPAAPARAGADSGCRRMERTTSCMREASSMDGVVIYGRSGFYLSPLAAIGFTHLFEPGK